MPLRDILKKKEKVAECDAPAAPEALRDAQQDEGPTSPVFTFMRSDTHTQEIISPPTFSSTESSGPPSFTDGHNESRTSRLFKGRARSSSAASAASSTSHASEKSKSKSPNAKRLSQRLHLRRSEVSSSNVPTDLPEITVGEVDDGAGAESQWEKRATILAKKNEQERSRPSTPVGSTTDLNAFADLSMGGGRPGKEKGPISTKHADDDIQEAIRLHEAGDLENSTRMFGRLADPHGENNALSQVLYGLALRYVNWPLPMQPEPL
jgi:hypothetical protein